MTLTHNAYQLDDSFSRINFDLVRHPTPRPASNSAAIPPRSADVPPMPLPWSQLRGVVEITGPGVTFSDILGHRNPTPADGAGAADRPRGKCFPPTIPRRCALGSTAAQQTSATSLISRGNREKEFRKSPFSGCSELRFNRSAAHGRDAHATMYGRGKLPGVPDAPAQTPIPENALCLGCNYPLRDLPANRCPECGREFDAADPWTMNFGDLKFKLLEWNPFG